MCVHKFSHRSFLSLPFSHTDTRTDTSQLSTVQLPAGHFRALSQNELPFYPKAAASNGIPKSKVHFTNSLTSKRGNYKGTCSSLWTWERKSLNKTWYTYKRWYGFVFKLFNDGLNIFPNIAYIWSIHTLYCCNMSIWTCFWICCQATTEDGSTSEREAVNIPQWLAPHLLEIVWKKFDRHKKLSIMWPPHNCIS